MRDSELESLPNRSFGSTKSAFAYMVAGVVTAASAVVLAAGIQTAEYFGIVQVIGLPTCLVVSMLCLVRSARGGKWFLVAVVPIAAVNIAVFVLVFCL